jgi:hypothetical protein
MMTQTIAAETLGAHTERIRRRPCGWLHALPGGDVFPDEFLAGLAGKDLGDTVHLTTGQRDHIFPSTQRNPVAAGPAVIDECMFDYADGDDGVLLYVDIVEGTLTDDGADFTIEAIHHPRDVYAAPGTPLRHVMDVLQGGFDVHAIFDARQALLRDTGVDDGAQWLASAPFYRGREFWDTCPKEFWDTYCGGIEAANRAPQAAGRNRDFPQPGMSTHGNDEYIALAARDLIGTRRPTTICGLRSKEQRINGYIPMTGRHRCPKVVLMPSADQCSNQVPAFTADEFTPFTAYLTAAPADLIEWLAPSNAETSHSVRTAKSPTEVSAL